MSNSDGHKFHIPVLGVGYSVDTPVKVAKYGITSVVSIIDDTLLERLREFYLKRLGRPYVPIKDNHEDSRARRVTAYLNTLNTMVREQFTALKNSGFDAGSELHKYFELLPDTSRLKTVYQQMMTASEQGVVKSLQKWLTDTIRPGAIDVNIMTKVDKANYDSKGNLLPVEYNDAHSALRGYAKSDLDSSIIFSAGMNPRLYSYMATLKEFLPHFDGGFRKRIVIKVSDFRSALIQGKFLAKKGLWVSEFRIESGLNCGGHAFATNGLLLGPILEEFKAKRDELFSTMRNLFLSALPKKGVDIPEPNLRVNVTVQGGVGTASEHDFLMRYYHVDSVGWGSPFLLVPEVMNVDDETLAKLSAAGEDDLYLSDVSPLGVPFNNLRDSSKDVEKWEKVRAGKPGSACVKKFLISNVEFSEKPICTASIAYLRRKSDQLKKENLAPDEYNEKFNKMMDKACLCEGLTVSALTTKNFENPKLSKAASVCPGPNLAYYSKISSLKEMVDHIYGRINLVTDPARPNMFVKELSLYIDYFQKKMQESLDENSQSVEKVLTDFYENLLSGIEYYRRILPDFSEESEKVRARIQKDLEALEERLSAFAPMSHYMA